MDWRSLPEAGRFTTVLRSRQPQSTDPCYLSAVWCLLLICNGNCVFFNSGVDQNCKWGLFIYFNASKNCDINDIISLIRNL